MSVPAKEKTARVFFALWPGKAQREALAAWQVPLKKRCGGRAMRAETLHVTLVFLGAVAQHRLEELQRAAREVAGAPFTLRLDRVRFWGHNRIAFAAPSETPELLRQLVSDLERKLRRHRFRFDRRSYQPHVTLLRKAGCNDAMLPSLPDVSWRVRQFVLVHSLSDENGARYEVLARFPLI